ncbi:MAG: hypothetical protein K6F54_12230 [Lachnospiraceae bacterium]|nr:hypothetical protein [Lachnospiraceae bacterium]
MGVFKNIAGYPDPTAGMAISNAMREYKQHQKKEFARKYAIRSRPKAYAVSPFAGDVQTHIKEAIALCRYLISQNKIPVASHLLYPQILDDADPEQRELGLLYGLTLLEMCDEVVVLSDGPDDISPGMAGEIHEAKRLGKPIRYIKREVVL